MPVETAAPRSVAEITEGAAPETPGGGQTTVPPAQALASPATPKYIANIFPGAASPLSPVFATQVKKLQDTLGMPVLMLVQGGDTPFDDLDDLVFTTLLAKRKELPVQEIALLIDSPGGSAKTAFQIAKLFRESCGGFTAVIPRYAKSAATLLVLGASKILMGSYGELGPLDAQIDDSERGRSSALDEVQALERLHAFALEAVDSSMFLLIRRLRKKPDIMLPIVMKFVTDMVSPLFEKIDAVHYTQMSRVLKVAEEYAIRLLQGKYKKDEAERIARDLVIKYPEHGFIIDSKEAATLGLKIDTATPEQLSIIDSLTVCIGGFTAIGLLEEVSP